MPARKKKTEASKAVRTAVDKTFQATVGGAQGTRDRAQEIVDDVVGAATRVRTVLEDLRVATGEDLRALREEIASLERRVRKLEGPLKKTTRATKASSKKTTKR